MHKDQFLRQLSNALRDLRVEDREDVLLDYELHFSAAIAEGKTEMEIAESLGNPLFIAREVRADNIINAAVHHATTGNLVRAVFASVSLGFFNIIVVLGPAIALCGAIVAGWVCAIAFVCSPLAIIFGAAANGSGADIVKSIFFSAVVVAIGLMLWGFMRVSTAALYRLFLRYLQANRRIIRGREG